MPRADSTPASTQIVLTAYDQTMQTQNSVEIKPTIVVIDDDHHILELVSLVLSRRGYRVITTQSPYEGLLHIKHHSPELVLLDYMMPQMDGLTALKEIRTHFPTTSVVMFTGKGSEEIAVNVMKAGASEYIAKPFNNNNLLERLDNVLRIRDIELHNQALQQQQAQLLKEIEKWNHELQERVREKTEALQKAQTEITQSEKLAALGYLSAGMAHDIRNPLNSISLFVQLLRQCNNDPEQHEYQDKILKEIDRIDAIISNLIDASRRTRTIIDNVQITNVIDTTLDYFAPQIESGNIRVIKEYAPQIPTIKADPTELEQIFTNLFLNALDEMKNGGVLALEVTGQQERVVVKVKDNGSGIAREILPRIFEPFVSSKARGTGMGLPVVKRIVTMYQGVIHVESTSASGTIFCLEFPVS